MRRAGAALLAALGAALLLCPGGAGVATAQTAPTPSATATATATPDFGTGSIEGAVRNGTAGGAAPEVTVQLLVVRASGEITAQSQATVGGAFRFEASADPSATYLLRTEYQGVPYLDSAPMVIAHAGIAVRRDLTVWETTLERPALRIAETVVRLEGVSPQQAQVQLAREDTVLNPTDRVYVGEAVGLPTLRIPAPDGVVAVDAEQGFDATASLAQGVVMTTQPLRPGSNLVRTRVLASFDAAKQVYTLRVTAPLATDATEVRVPARMVRALQSVAPAGRAPELDEAGEHWLVSKRSGGAREGESMIVTLSGVGGSPPVSPLTSTRGAGIGVAVALAVLVAGFAALSRVRTARHGEAAG